ncbi:unnamed protein product [Spirodela intermedia]|uniref:Uncharacterized protein n=1 Tax=Spirodela intermedia TaxID=51605 RepID=A0A7I8L6J4_SPIIN|nr:unnamed protein product [Spirodela intermedia]
MADREPYVPSPPTRLSHWPVLPF